MEGNPQDIINEAIKKEGVPIRKLLITAAVAVIVITVSSFYYAIQDSKKIIKERIKQAERYSTLETEKNKLATQYSSLIQGVIGFLGHTNVSSIVLSNNGGYSLTMNPSKFYGQAWKYGVISNNFIASKVELVFNNSVVDSMTNNIKQPIPPKKRLKSAFER